MHLPGVGCRAVAALSVGLVLLPVSGSPAAQRKAAGASKATAKVEAAVAIAPATSAELRLLELINAERRSHKLKPVVWDAELTRIARLHGIDQRDAGRPSHHSSKGGADYGGRLASTSYRASAACENIAWNSTVERAHRMLMDSPHHRANILDPNMTNIGVGIVPDEGGRFYFVEDFAAPIARLSDAEAKKKMSAALLAPRKKSWFGKSLREDPELTRQLDRLLDELIASGMTKNPVGTRLGPGWSLAFTAVDPDAAPQSALEYASKADGYALTMRFRKTPRYPLGIWWGIVFFKGDFFS